MNDINRKDLKDRYSISADELEHRMKLQDEVHNDPARKAALVLEEAIGKVMIKLGIDTTQDDETIKVQMDLLGVMLNELPGYPGIFITTTIPTPKEYAWISDAILNSDGSYNYEIHWFREEKMSETARVKLIK